jgi:hypothetical protein
VAGYFISDSVFFFKKKKGQVINASKYTAYTSACLIYLNTIYGFGIKNSEMFAWLHPVCTKVNPIPFCGTLSCMWCDNEVCKLPPYACRGSTGQKLQYGVMTLA